MWDSRPHGRIERVNRRSAPTRTSQVRLATRPRPSAHLGEWTQAFGAEPASPCAQRYLIASAPPVMIFHLKRFQATGRGFVSGLAGFKKIDDQITFPEYLDITPWLAPPREEYDRRGRLKASSDPLAIRRRAEEEATNAGVDARTCASRCRACTAAARATHITRTRRAGGTACGRGICTTMPSTRAARTESTPRAAIWTKDPRCSRRRATRLCRRSSGGQDRVPPVRGDCASGLAVGWPLHGVRAVGSDQAQGRSEGARGQVGTHEPHNTPAPPGSSIAAGSSKDTGGLGQFFLAEVDRHATARRRPHRCLFDQHRRRLLRRWP